MYSQQATTEQIQELQEYYSFDFLSSGGAIFINQGNLYL